MGWGEVLAAVLGFTGGVIAGLMKLVMPAYVDLHRENAELRERVRGLEDALRDHAEEAAWRVKEGP